MILSKAAPSSWRRRLKALAGKSSLPWLFLAGLACRPGRFQTIARRDCHRLL
jgi:hypothetical protein